MKMAGSPCCVIRLFVSCILFLAGAFRADATNLTWAGTSNTTGSWFSAGSWTPSQVPGDGDAVTITNGGVLLTNQSAVLSSLSISNATLVFSNWTTRLQATNITIHTNGTFTLPPPFLANAMSNRIWVICSNLTLNAGGQLLASERGYYRTNGVGKGANAVTRYRGSGGAGYGGKGGTGGYQDVRLAAGGNPYGSTNAPLDPGSGGGVIINGAYAFGHGGGAIWISASGRVTVDGRVSANGGNGGLDTVYNDTPSGGGSGGSILILCSSFGGDSRGLLSANGGNAAIGPTYSGFGGGGGGGRISVGIGLSEANRNNLLAGTPIPGMITYSADPSFAGSLSVSGGTDTYHRSVLVPPDGAYPGTRQFIKVLSADERSLVISGDPAFYGTPSTNGYGTWVVPNGVTLTNEIAQIANEQPAVRWSCTGWRLTGQGGEALSSGTGTQAVFVVTTNAVLTWQWTNQYPLSIGAAPNGSVNGGDRNGWYTNGVVVTNLLATPASGYYFVTWVGADVPAGQALSNPLSVTMSQPRTNLTAAFASLAGEAKTWTGYGNWTSSTNWSPQGIPGLNDTVFLKTGTSVISEAYAIASLVVTAQAGLVFSNWNTCLTAGNVTILSNGWLSLPPAFATNQMSNRIWVACSSFTLDPGGQVNADKKGYLSPQGPGRGDGSSGGIGSGGGYGGQGGMGSSKYPVRAPYGDVRAPTDPGSGGGTYPDYIFDGHGGGAVWISASGTMTINGTISANGGSGGVSGQAGGGGGSGGSIYLTCDSFGGGLGGLVQVNGGNAPPSYGGGGGGRISLLYQSLIDTPGVRFSANRSTNTWMTIDINAPMDKPAPQPGTLNFSTPALLDNVLKSWSGVATGLNGYVYFQSATLWSATNLMTLNDSFLGIPEGSEFVFASDLNVMTGGLLVASRATLSCDGKLTLTNGASLVVYGGETNSTYVTGALVRVRDVLTVSSSCWIYPFSHSTNGGSLLMQVGSLAIRTGGGISADGRGFGMGIGPGRGTNSNSRYLGTGGGGYGGKGGSGSTTVGGTAYGSSNAPVLPGSGGGVFTEVSNAGHGGGVVRIDSAGPVILDGTLSANGANGKLTYGDTPQGAGSGGAIYLTCSSLRGSSRGVLQASGGAGAYFDATHVGGGGGGGRIAVWIGVSEDRRQAYLAGTPRGVTTSEIAPSSYQGAYLATNGTGFYNTPSALASTRGTILFFTGPPRGTILLIQ